MKTDFIKVPLKHINGCSFVEQKNTKGVFVTETSYISMNKTKNLDKEFKNEDINLLEKALLVEENTKLKNEIKELNYKLENKEIVEEDDMEM